MKPIVTPAPFDQWMALPIEERKARLRKRKPIPESPKPYRRPSQTERDATFRAQKKCCAICKSRKPGSKNGWHNDHCHASQKARGVLCHHCNIMLGAARDNIAILSEGIKYLIRHSNHAAAEKAALGYLERLNAK